jgi:transposase
MSTSLLYHVFGAKDYRYLKEEFKNGETYFHIEKAPFKSKCATCGSKDVIKFGKVTRQIKTIPTGSRSTWLILHLHRLKCRACGAVELEPLIISDPKKHWSRKLGRYILDMLKHMTIKALSEHLKMSWDTLKEIHKDALSIRMKKRRYKNLEYLGVDEVAVKKGHSYLTVVVDLTSGEVVWVSECRDTNSLEEFMLRLKRSKAKIKGIAMDMWKPYINAVIRHFGAEVVVFDHYHIISDYNKTLDDLRRMEAASASIADKNIYRGVRYLLLTGKQKIENDSEAKSRLNRLLELNTSLSIAYVMKEELRRLFDCRSPAEAESYLDGWIAKARASLIAPLIKFANKLYSHRTGIFNYFKHRITTGKVEGINNKIKVLKRQAYGFRDMEYFKLRICFLNEANYSLIG